MKNLLVKTASLIHAMNERIGRITSWLTLVLVLLVCFDVIARKIFNFSRIWIMDLEWHIYAMIFLLAAGFSLKNDRHVRVDLFYEKFSPRDKALTDFLGHLLFLIPWSITVIIFSFSYALESFELNEGSPEPGGLPARYIIKFVITIGILLLFFQAIAGLIDAGIQLKKRKN